MRSKNTEVYQYLNRKDWLIDQLINNRGLSLFILIIAISIGISALYPKTFFSFTNLSSILLSLSLEGMLAVGMMFLLVSGAFDLSIGSNIAVGGAMAAYLLKTVGSPIPIAIIGGIAICASAGIINGLLVSKVGVNALIVTLAMMGILRGIAILIAGAGIVNLPEGFISIGQKSLFRLQMPVYYMLSIVAIGTFLLSKTRYFRQLYFIGGNRKAAVLSGIKVNNTIIVNFILMGVIAGIGGVVLVARLNAAIGHIGAGVELRVITAVIIGGGSILGGRGTILGAFMGAMFMGLIDNIMVITGLNVYFQSIVRGSILIAAVSIDVVFQKKHRIITG